MNERPMTATELVIKNKLYWEERMPEFDRVMKKYFGDALDRLMRVIHTRTILGPTPTFMQDCWDLICVALVISTLAFMTWLTLHVNGVL